MCLKHNHKHLGQKQAVFALTVSLKGFTVWSRRVSRLCGVLFAKVCLHLISLELSVSTEPNTTFHEVLINLSFLCKDRPTAAGQELFLAPDARRQSPRQYSLSPLQRGLVLMNPHLWPLGRFLLANPLSPGARARAPEQELVRHLAQPSAVPSSTMLLQTSSEVSSNIVNKVLAVLKSVLWSMKHPL
jgi:hypothetical protein